jgi:hypothetical protein
MDLVGEPTVISVKDIPLHAHLLAARPRPAGGCGDSGRLDKDEARAMREYVQPVVLFRDAALVERTLEEVRRLLDGGGGGGGGNDPASGGASTRGQSEPAAAGAACGIADAVEEQQQHVPPL